MAQLIKMDGSETTISPKKSKAGFQLAGELYDLLAGELIEMCICKMVG
jgi:hypothetical protein